MNPSFKGKIAVFISGPCRYVSKVTHRIDHLFRNQPHDCFFHLWKSDLGNKVRSDEEKDMYWLYAHPRAKVIIQQSPYSVVDFARHVGEHTNSNSTINATMGMFFSVNLLCHYLEQIPDVEDYRYILRLRTDCAIFNDRFLELLDPAENVLTLSKNPFIPNPWISDHICFGTSETFRKLWRYDDMKEIYEAYQAGNRNPEQTLRKRCEKTLPTVRLNRSLIRFKDYHIVYMPPRDCDPATINDTLMGIGLDRFFEEGGRRIDSREVDQFIADNVYENQNSLVHKPSPVRPRPHLTQATHAAWATIRDSHEISEKRRIRLNSADPEAMEEKEPTALSSVDSARTHFDKGESLFKLGDKKKALSHFVSAAGLEPDNPVYNKRLAAFLAAEHRQITQALKIYIRVLNKNPRDIEALLAVAQICMDQKRFQDAYEIYLLAFQLDPGNPQALDNLSGLRSLGEGKGVPE